MRLKGAGSKGLAEESDLARCLLSPRGLGKGATPSCKRNAHQGARSYRLTRASGNIFKTLTSQLLNIDIFKNLEISHIQNKSHKHEKRITSLYCDLLRMFFRRLACILRGIALQRRAGGPRDPASLA